MEAKDSYASIWIGSGSGQLALEQMTKDGYPTSWNVSGCGLEAQDAYPSTRLRLHGCRLEAKAAYASIWILSGSGQ
jgi:hypothetical protein